MGTIQKDSIVKTVLKNLCCSYGWSYGVFWSFDQPNSLLLTMQDAYYEEKIEGLIDDLRLEVSMLGEGIIGQAGFTKKHQWIFSENHYTGDNSLGSIWDMFRDESEFRCQFSSGIKTIAVIPVEPQGVVQFGSIEKILERTEFVNQTKRMFHEIVNDGGPEIVPCSSANSQSCPRNGLFASLISPESSHFTGDAQNSVGPASSSAYPPLSCCFSSKSRAIMLNHNQSTTQLQPDDPFLQFTGDVNSTLTSFKEPLISESRALESWNSFSTQSNSHLTFANTNQDLFDSLPDFGIPDEFFQTEDFNVSQWFPPSPEQSNVTLGGPTQKDDLLSQTVGLLPICSDEKAESLAVSGVDFDLLGNTGDWGGIVMPVGNESSVDFRSYDSENMSVSTSTKNAGIDSTALGPKKGLFSKLGIEELLEGISGTSNAASTSCIEDQVSSAVKRRKTGNSTWEMSSSQPVVYDNILEPKGKSLPGLWMGNAYSMNCSSMISQTRKQVEPPKPTKKKAKPGTRPRPKDRQQILDRMAELRELIPNGQKMSIDCLLDRTIKHMLFLQSVTKHADRIKQADEPKNNYSSDPNSNGVTWACELGSQTMICPLIVEDLSTPRQMLIEMLCEEQGFFLEIVDILRGFGLTILKGVMEVRDKIWARFVVEAEAKRHVTRHEIFSALVRHLQVTSPTDNELHNRVVEEGNSILNNFQQSGVQLPVSMAETRYCTNL